MLGNIDEKIFLEAALRALNGLCANPDYDGDNQDTAIDAVEIGRAFAEQVQMQVDGKWITED